MPEVRAFLAIPLSEAVIAQAQRLRRCLCARLPSVRWVNPASMHLTLKFFGNLPEESLEKIEEVMLSVGGSRGPFEARIGGLGAFPSAHRPRVIWLGVHGGPPLLALHQDLDAGLEKIGIPRDDRSFSPHLTLGRVKGRLADVSALLEKCSDRAAEPMPVDRMILFESRLRPSGAVHLPLKTVWLTP